METQDAPHLRLRRGRRGLLWLLILASAALSSACSWRIHTDAAFTPSAYRTVYLEPNEADRFNLNSRVHDELARAGLAVVNERSAADLLVTWHYAEALLYTSATVSVRNRRGTIVYTGESHHYDLRALVDPHETTGSRLERALSGLKMAMARRSGSTPARARPSRVWGPLAIQHEPGRSATSPVCFGSIDGIQADSCCRPQLEPLLWGAVTPRS